MESLIDLLPMLGGGLFGALMTLWGNAQKDKADAHARTMEALTAQHKQVQHVNSVATKNKGFAWTRRIIALSVTSVVVGAFWMMGEVNVPIEVKEGGSYLFGLIDTTNIKVEYEKLSGAVLIPEVIDSFQAVMGAYFGSSMVKR